MYGRFPSEDEEVRLGLEMDVPMWMTVVDRELPVNITVELQHLRRVIMLCVILPLQNSEFK